MTEAKHNENAGKGKDPKEFMKPKDEKHMKKEHPKKEEVSEKTIQDILENLNQEGKKENVEEKDSKDDKEQKIAELTDMLKRTQAEFINFKNRTEKETRQICEYASFDMIKKVLPVLDTFELALKNAPESDFKKGIELVYAQLLDAFKSEGLRPIEALGKKFDPYFHEVMLKEKSGKAEDIIIEEFQRGYMLKDKVLRYSKVKVSAGN